MTTIALTFNSLAGAVSGSYRRVSQSLSIPSSKEIYLTGLILSLLQIADGVLTAIGIFKFGVHAEGNPLLKSLMIAIGPVEALIVVKMIAIIVIATLCLLASQITWVTKALKGMIILYICAAIIPWTAILTSH
jgi:hypothetical protein